MPSSRRERERKIESDRKIEGIYLSSGFLSARRSTDWMRPAHIREGEFSLLQSTDLYANLF